MLYFLYIHIKLISNLTLKRIQQSFAVKIGTKIMKRRRARTTYTTDPTLISKPAVGILNETTDE